MPWAYLSLEGHLRILRRLKIPHSYNNSSFSGAHLNHSSYLVCVCLHASEEAQVYIYIRVWERYLVVFVGEGTEINGGKREWTRERDWGQHYIYLYLYVYLCMYTMYIQFLWVGLVSGLLKEKVHEIPRGDFIPAKFYGRITFNWRFIHTSTHIIPKAHKLWNIVDRPFKQVCTIQS